jgi:hypothetical protein
LVSRRSNDDWFLECGLQGEAAIANDCKLTFDISFVAPDIPGLLPLASTITLPCIHLVGTTIDWRAQSGGHGRPIGERDTPPEKQANSRSHERRSSLMRNMPYTSVHFSYKLCQFLWENVRACMTRSCFPLCNFSSHICHGVLDLLFSDALYFCMHAKNAFSDAIFVRLMLVSQLVLYFGVWDELREDPALLPFSNRGSQETESALTCATSQLLTHSPQIPGKWHPGGREFNCGEDYPNHLCLAYGLN